MAVTEAPIVAPAASESAAIQPQQQPTPQGGGGGGIFANQDLRNKYQKVQKPKETSPDNEIRVTGTGRIANYVTYAAKLFNQMEKRSITIRATGKAVSVAVTVAEVVKRRFKGLHQVTSIGCTEIVDTYMPLEDGLDELSETRVVSFASILLAKDISLVDPNALGYQAPLDEALVKELEPDVVTRTSRGRGRGGPRRRGRGGPRTGTTPVSEANTDNGAASPAFDGPKPTRGRARPRGRGGRGRPRRVNPNQTATAESAPPAQQQA